MGGRAGRSDSACLRSLGSSYTKLELHHAAPVDVVALEREAVLAFAAREQPDPAAEHDGQDTDGHVVDQIGGEELRDDLAAVDVDPRAARQPGQQGVADPHRCATEEGRT